MSILIPVHDGAPHLRATLRSALGQSVTDVEVVALDDGSGDASAAILSEFATDPRIRLLHHDRAQGAAATWNELLDAATGEYVILLPQDDLLDPDAVEHRLRAMHSQPGTVGVLARHRLVDARGRSFGSTTSRFWRRMVHTKTIGAADLVVASARAGGNVAGPPGTLLARREVLRSLRYRQEAGYAIDLDLVIRLAGAGTLVALPRVDCDFRVHGGAWTHRLRRRQTADFVRLLTEAGSRLPPGLDLPGLVRVRAAARTLLRRAVYLVVRMRAGRRSAA